MVHGVYYSLQHYYMLHMSIYSFSVFKMDILSCYLLLGNIIFCKKQIIKHMQRHKHFLRCHISKITKKTLNRNRFIFNEYLCTGSSSQFFTLTHINTVSFIVDSSMIKSCINCLIITAGRLK